MKPLREAQEEFRRNYIAATYEACGKNKVRTAQVLGIYRVDLYRLLEKYDIAHRKKA